MTKDWTRTDVKRCNVCEDTQRLVFVRGFMLCPKHDNAKTVADIVTLRDAQEELRKVKRR